MPVRGLLVAAALLASVPAGAIAAPNSAVSTSQFQLNKARIDKALAQMVADGRAVGTSALVWQGGKEIYFGSAGFADREAKKPFRRDTLVQIWSMTKPVTGVALMQLWEQGKFGLDDPLSDFLPEFAQTPVYAGLDGAGKPILRPPHRPILIRDVLRHSAGLGDGPGPLFPHKVFVEADTLNLGNDLTEFGRRLATVPLLYEPGAEWRYSLAVDVQALLVEKISGQPFEAYVLQHILDPLGMKETGWTQPEERYARLAVPYAKGPDGTRIRMSETEIRQSNFDPKRKLTRGGAGLVSSLDDYMRFARMLLNNGALDGVRMLKPSTVKLMATDHLDPKTTERSWLVGKGQVGFGIDFAVRKGQPKTAEENRGSVGEFFWDGAWTTLFWVDPANRLTVVYFVQSAPFEGTLHRDIRRAVYGDAYLGPKGD